MGLTIREKWLIVAIAVLLIVGFAIFSRQRVVTGSLENIAEYKAKTEQEMKTYKDENGKLHGQVEVLVADKNTFLATYGQKLDSIAKVLDIKTKNIEQYVQIGIKTTGSIKSRIDTTYVIDTNKNNVTGETTLDTTKTYQVNYKDNWMYFSGNIVKDSFIANYNVKDSLTFITYKKKTGFLGLGKGKTLMDVTSTNPNASYFGIKGVELKDLKPKRFGIGPYVGFDPITMRPSAGLSVNYNLIKF